MQAKVKATKRKFTPMVLQPLLYIRYIFVCFWALYCLVFAALRRQANAFCG